MNPDVEELLKKSDQLWQNRDGKQRCLMCDHMLISHDNPFCKAFNDHPPVEFLDQVNQCERYVFDDIPF